MDTREAGSLGGKASAKSLTKQQRIARAKKAVAVREANRAAKKNLSTSTLPNPK